MTLARHSILVLEHNVDETALIRHALQLHSDGVEITGCPDLEEALRRIENDQIDIVFLDARSMNGGLRETVFRIKSRGCEPPSVVALSVNDHATGAMLLESGVCDYVLAGGVHPTYLPGVVRSLMERRKLSKALSFSEERYARLLRSVTDYTYSVAINDGGPVSTSHSPGCAAVTGYSPNEYDADPNLWFRMIHEADREAVLQMSSQIVAGRTPQPLEHRIVHRDGSIRWIRNTPLPRYDQYGRLIAYDGLVKDITDQKRAEEDLRHAAYHDSLTGLPNRELFYDRLQQALIHAKRYDGMLAVMFLDLDRFKEINDTLGHRAGDHVLASVAGRLTNCARESDTVARYGGDEFLLLFPGIRQAPEAALIARKLNDALSEAYVLHDQEIVVTSSIGISLYPENGDDAETLIKFADVAMYQSKSEVSGSYRFYTHTMNAEAHQRLLIENHLRKALERNEFVLHYQPQVELASGRIVGNEALLRWRHPRFGLLAPREFIPVAEDTGLIIPIGAWAIETACAQNMQWQETCGQPIRMAVNLSMRQFRQHNVTQTVESILRKSGLSAPLLDLELTESVIMKDEASTIETLRELKALGVNLTIDDFGTGYSSLRYLKDLPVNALKLDQSFVGALSEGGYQGEISKTIITLAHTLGLRVIAEGVETVDQLERLRGMGCDEMQGHLFSRPVPSEELARLLMQQAY
jgi:diguanylate cyclase (GGDEF)-like protein/PAS domain S-box-containing protein